MKGFTLIEILIAMGILAIIGGFGLFVSLDFYRSNVIFSERDTLLSLLRRARLDAVNNIQAMPHGLYVATTSYILFAGSSYAARSSTHDYAFDKSVAVTTGGLTEVVFSPLAATSTASGTITLADETRNLEILVNYEGMIDW